MVLGTRGFQAFVNEFRGEPKIHIRKQFTDPVTGEKFHTKNGITLSLKEWEDLQANIHSINMQLGLLERKAEAMRRREARGFYNNKSAVPYRQNIRKPETRTIDVYPSERDYRRCREESQRKQCYQEQYYPPIDVKIPNLQDLTSEETMEDLFNATY